MAKAKPVKQPSKALVKWDEEMAVLADQMGDARTTSSGGKFIGTRGAVFAIDGEDIGSELDVVILDHVNENQYYDGPFDQDNPQPPVCFAFSRTQDMKPHDDAVDKQCESCGKCPMNAYGSAGNGRKGKACKNVMRLALITEGDLDDITAAEVRYLKVSTTNVKAYNEFLNKLKNPNLNLGKKPLPCAVVCRMTIKPSKKTQIELGFEVREAITDDEQRVELLAKVREQIGKTEFPYSPPGEEEEKPAPKNTKISRGRR